MAPVQHNDPLGSGPAEPSEEPWGGVGWGACRKRAAQACLGPVLEPPDPRRCPVTLSQGADFTSGGSICVLGAETPTVHDQRMLTMPAPTGPQKSWSSPAPQPPCTVLLLPPGIFVPITLRPRSKSLLPILGGPQVPSDGRVQAQTSFSSRQEAVLIRDNLLLATGL